MLRKSRLISFAFGKAGPDSKDGAVFSDPTELEELREVMVRWLFSAAKSQVLAAVVFAFLLSFQLTITIPSMKFAVLAVFLPFAAQAFFAPVPASRTTKTQIRAVSAPKSTYSVTLLAGDGIG